MNLQEKYNCLDVTSDIILKDEKWFVGSSLSTIKIENLGLGNYYLKQDTIWTKYLNLSRVNNYWKIHNKVESYLFINQKFSIKLLLDFLNDFFTLEGVDIEQVYVVLPSKFYDLFYFEYKIEQEVPFYINKERVGEYIKVFLKIKNRYYPYLDIPLFSCGKKKIIEIHINEHYINEAKGIPRKGILNHFDKKGNESEKIVLNSCLEAILFLSKYKFTLDGSYKGHIIKKILKKISFLTIFLDVNIDTFLKEVNLKYKEFICKEIKKINSLDLENILKLNEQKLREEMGINKDIIKLKMKKYKGHDMPKQIDDIEYFTDIPLIDNITDLSDAIKVVINKLAKRT